MFINNIIAWEGGVGAGQKTLIVIVIKSWPNDYLFPNTYDLLKVAGELAEAWRDGSSSWGGGLSLLFVLFFFF